MDHIRDGADLVHGVKHIDRLGGIRHTNGDALAFFDPEGAEGASGAVDFFHHFAVGDFFTEIIKCDIVRVFTTGVINHVVETALGVLLAARQGVEVAVASALQVDVGLLDQFLQGIGEKIKHTL